MKSFSNLNARDVKHASQLSANARRKGETPVFAGGGSDLLGMVKEGIVRPDQLVNLKTIRNNDAITTTPMFGAAPKDALKGKEAPKEGVPGATIIGGLITLDTLSRDPAIRKDYPVLAEAAGTVATPQIRNVGTLAGNICQRPWCWYFRNGFPCYKAGGNQCFSVTGENQFHAIFGGGPSFIVHPSDTAPALVALGATFQLSGPKGIRMVRAADFFVLPKQNAQAENILLPDEFLVDVRLPSPRAGQRSSYHKVMDREAWTHAVVSVATVLEMDGKVCRRASIVLGGVAPIPWRVPAAEQVLNGQVVTPALAARAAAAAMAGANPLAKNRYKVPLAQTSVERQILAVAKG